MGLSVTVAIREARLAQEVGALLEDTGIEYLVPARVSAQPGTAGPAGVSCCWVSAEQPETDADLHLLVSSEPADGRRVIGQVRLSADELTGAALLRSLAMASASWRVDSGARELAELEMFSFVPSEVLRAFLSDPHQMHRLSDLRRVLRLSRSRARTVVRSTKRFERAEHLLAALRCATWALLMTRGAPRTLIEKYLGINDHAAFRRACHRSQVPSPRKGMSLTAFSR